MIQPSMPPLASALRSLWDPHDEPGDPLVRWLERKLACRRWRDRGEVAVASEPEAAPPADGEVGVVKVAR